MSFYTAFFLFFPICIHFVNLITLFRLSTLKIFFLLSVMFLVILAIFSFHLKILNKQPKQLYWRNVIPFPIDLFLVFLKRRIKLNTSQKSRVCHIILSSLPSFYSLCKPQIWFFEKELPISQGLGIILCLPNGDKPTQYLKNWRLITLLNVLHKPISVCISYRMKAALDYSYIWYTNGLSPR